MTLFRNNNPFYISNKILSYLSFKKFYLFTKNFDGKNAFYLSLNKNFYNTKIINNKF